MAGKDIATVADSVSRNGIKNTFWGTLLLIATVLIVIGFKCKLKKSTENNKYRNNLVRDKLKHEYVMEELHQKNELKKEIINFRRKQKETDQTFNVNTIEGLDDEDASVETYDEVVSGEEILYTALRLALRFLHIGEDCGFIGRTNIGKTSFILHLAIVIARGWQELGARISPEWSLEQPMKVLYFAFEQNRNHFKTKYGRFIKNIPNLYIDVKTSAGDFRSIKNKIMNMQNKIGDHRLLVIFDNITKMKNRKSDDKSAFFQWLEDYRVHCNDKGTPITYLKIYHTTGTYKDYMPLDSTTNYGDKTDTYFTQDLVGFGLCKGGDGKLRYIKELKNKLEPDGEKQTVSVYRFADTETPMYDYIGEFPECDVLPSKSDLVRGNQESSHNFKSSRPPGKRGRSEDYTHELLVEMNEEHKAGFSWREIMDCHGIEYDLISPEGVNNKAKGIKQAMKRHGIR